MYNLVEELKLDEGYRKNLYKCSEDKLTIGYGFNVEAGVSRRVAEAILREQVAEKKDELIDAGVFVRIHNTTAQDVLTNMAFQMGVRGLLKFKNCLRALEAEDYNKAADEMLDSRWAKQTPNRAEKLSDIIRSL